VDSTRPLADRECVRLLGDLDLLGTGHHPRPDGVGAATVYAALDSPPREYT